MLNRPSDLEAEIYRTEIALDEARSRLDLTIRLARVALASPMLREGILRRYAVELRNVVWYERYGWQLDPTHPFFQPQGVLK